MRVGVGAVTGDGRVFHPADDALDGGAIAAGRDGFAAGLDKSNIETLFTVEDRKFAATWLGGGAAHGDDGAQGIDDGFDVSGAQGDEVGRVDGFGKGGQRGDGALGEAHADRAGFRGAFKLKIVAARFH